MNNKNFILFGLVVGGVLTAGLIMNYGKDIPFVEQSREGYRSF